MTDYSFRNLIDVDKVEQLLETSHRLSGMTYALLDNNENVLVSVGWQEVCTRFHRVHPVCTERCRESDAHIKEHLGSGAKDYIEYRCGNGLIDVAMPIVIEGRHLATFFTGQFFYDDNPPEWQFFLCQAREFGFDPDDYLAALKRVPVFSREYIRDKAMYLHSMVRILAESGLKSLKLALEMEQRTRKDEEIRRWMTERNQAQAQLNRTLTILNSCRRTMMRADEEQTLLNSICRIICDEAGYRFCWVGYAENDDRKSVRPVAWAGAEQGYLDQADITWNDTERGWDPAGSAIRHGMSMCVQELATDSHFAPWRDAARERGFGSCVSLPLKFDGTTPFGVVTIYSPETHAFSPDEIRLLDELAEDLSFGISALRARSERNRVEQALREAYKRLDDLFAFLPDATFAIDSQGKVIAWNKAMERLTGIQAGHILGKGNGEYSVAFYGEVRPMLADFILRDGEGAEQWYEHLEKEENRYFASTLCVDRHDGQSAYFSAVAAAMFDSDGAMIGVSEQIRDVTEMWVTEMERKRLEEQLLQSRKMEAIGQLAGGIAHDFNNIMTAIVGFAYIIGTKLGGDSPLNMYLDKILASAERANGLTRDLLTFSRKQVMKLKPTELGKAVAGSQQLISRLLREDIELFVSTPGMPLTVVVGESHLTQILMNLAANARDAMPSGGKITITISSIVMDQEFVDRYGYGEVGMFARITFADTGCGMDETTRQRIFEPFFTTKEVGQGTGLGLATVFGIVKQLGGFINVYSEPGKGTIFTIYLPLVGGAEATEEAVTTDTPPPGGTELILLAEDDPNVREIGESLLSEAGYRVICAKDGTEALGMFSDHMDTIDLLVLDAVMPGKNGIEVFQRAQTLLPEIKAILVSGYTTEIMVVNGLIERGLRFLQKPVNPREFLRVVREVLDR